MHPHMLTSVSTICRHEHRKRELKSLERDYSSLPQRAHSLRDALEFNARRRGEVSYPDNLTLGNLGYFLIVPTLIYQTSYPRSSRFRGRWVLW